MCERKLYLYFAFVLILYNECVFIKLMFAHLLSEYKRDITKVYLFPALVVTFSEYARKTQFKFINKHDVIKKLLLK